MLKLRLASAAVLIVATLWALFAWPPSAFAAYLGFFILAGAWEWTRLAGVSAFPARAVYVLLIGAAGIALMQGPSSIQPLLALAVAFWLWVFIELVGYREITSGFLATIPGRLLAGFLVLLPAWMVPLMLRESQGPWMTLYSFALVWAADSGAYFAGHRFGRHKLAPAVSPGKTWEGVAGGLLTVLILALASGIYGWAWRGTDLLVWSILSLVVAFVSVLGDLFESRLKRIVGIKDSGTLIPGHGGILDRIDAYTAAAPLFALIWILWRSPAGVG